MHLLPRLSSMLTSTTSTSTSTSTRFSSSLPLLLLHLLTILTATPTNATETVIVTITATATAKSTATTTPIVPQDPSYTSSSLFKYSILDTSNTYRATYNASDLTWNDTLASYARDWAGACVWEHSHGPYGENLAYGYLNATSAVQAWGDEVALYDFNKPTGFTEETGHFTQLVWKGTREVGCAAVDCGLSEFDSDDDEKDDEEGKGTKRAQGWYVVCEMNVQEGSGDLDSLDEGDSDDMDSGETDLDNTGLSGAILKSGGGLLESNVKWAGWWVGMYILSSV
ncbi:CAP domain-containing protein [Aspergillus cavernicola]|uniref:CAP domain-containing protein n=1 Tax=Aspergillus cavernicola TaxID=176166 RepID=A0ABR4HKC3_9EURO